jgi:hypothetical protein
MSIKKAQLPYLVQREVEEQHDVFTTSRIAGRLSLLPSQVKPILGRMDCVVSAVGESGANVGRRRLNPSTELCGQCDYGKFPGPGPVCVILHPELKQHIE